jgi:hypothetical protein
MLNDTYSVYLIVAIGFLSAVTLNRGIYLYHKDQYVKLEESEKNLNLYNKVGFSSSEIHDNDTSDKKALREKYYNDKKTLSMQHFRVSLVGSILTIIGGHLPRHPVVSAGLMFGGMLNIIFSSIVSWNDLEEAEKFSVSAVGLFCLIAYVVYKYKS